MVLLIIAAFALLVFIQVPRLRKEKRKKELVFFCILTATGFLLFILLNAGVKIPGPIKIVMGFLDKIGLHYAATG